MRNAFLQLWLIVWVITLPLVHIHPDADHAHGMTGHVHGGTYHSILINTPVHSHQDHKKHHHDDVFFPGEAFGPSHSPHLIHSKVLKKRPTVFLSLSPR